MQFLDKVDTPAVAVWCRWPDSFLNTVICVPVVSQRQVLELGTLAPLAAHNCESSRSGGGADAGNFSQVSSDQVSSA